MNNVLEVTKLKAGEAVATAEPVYMNGEYAVPVSGDGNGMIFLVDNESISAGEVIVVAADNVFCGGDHTLYFKENSKSMIHFEGAPYVQRSGEYKGMILLRKGNEMQELRISAVEVL